VIGFARRHRLIQQVAAQLAGVHEARRAELADVVPEACCGELSAEGERRAADDRRSPARELRAAVIERQRAVDDLAWPPFEDAAAKHGRRGEYSLVRDERCFRQARRPGRIDVTEVLGLLGGAHTAGRRIDHVLECRVETRERQRCARVAVVLAVDVVAAELLELRCDLVDRGGVLASDEHTFRLPDVDGVDQTWPGDVGVDQRTDRSQAG